MIHLSRRSFVKNIAAIPLLFSREPEVSGETHAEGELPMIPTSIAGYLVPPDERDAIVRFLHTFEQEMAPIRKLTLPGSLEPAICFCSSEMLPAKWAP